MAQVQQVKSVMTRDVETLSPDLTLQEAADQMATLDVGPMPVVEGRRVVGILTDRDILLQAAQGRDPKSVKGRDVMTKQVDSVTEDTDAKEAAKLTREKQHRRLVVLDRNQQLAGIVSLADLPVGE